MIIQVPTSVMLLSIYLENPINQGFDIFGHSCPDNKGLTLMLSWWKNQTEMIQNSYEIEAKAYGDQLKWQI